MTLLRDPSGKINSTGREYSEGQVRKNGDCPSREYCAVPQPAHWLSTVRKETTYYDDLGARLDASWKNLKNTERQLALKYHPGKSGREGEASKQTSQAHRASRG